MEKKEDIRETVLIVNFGGQYTHLIGKAIRRLGTYTKIIYWRKLHEELSALGASVKALILSGGPRSVNEFEDVFSDLSFLTELNLPVLGICFGHQLLAKLLGGAVEAGEGEYGRTEIRIVKDDSIFTGWGTVEYVWMSHRDYVVSLPPETEVLAISQRKYIAAFRVKGTHIYGVQFHPEVSHTPKGMELLMNFLKVSGVKGSWGLNDYYADAVKTLNEGLKGCRKAIAAVSGGIDSTVAAVLAARKLGDRLIPILIDHGFFREGEVDEVLRNLRKTGLKPVFIDASDRFMKALQGVEGCDERRIIIGKVFAEIFKEFASRDPEVGCLIQGTTYPDVIESGGSEEASVIKRHHNVGGLPHDFPLKVVEPLRNLYKDEVRELGRYLRIPEEIVNRKPFPGPGLAIRVVGEVTREKVEIVRKASRIIEDELAKAGIDEEVWQAFAVVGDDRWVGVRGDERALGHILHIRVVSSLNGMTADWVEIPHEVLRRISWRITSEIPQVTMVTYAITPKPPSTIEPC